MRKLLALLSFFLLSFALVACGNGDEAGEKEEVALATEGLQTEGNAVQATILMENGDEIVMELFEEAAPNTVENFIQLVENGFYDGVTFHRVIPGFVAQGGDPTGTGAGGPGHTIDCELDGNPHQHLTGSLSMAHAGRNTGGSQFFIVHEPQPHLDGEHTVFGQVISGMDAVLAIEAGDVMQEITIQRN